MPGGGGRKQGVALCGKRKGQQMKTTAAVSSLASPKVRSGREGLKALTLDGIGSYQRIPARVDFVDHPSFSEPDIEDRLFGQRAGEIDVPEWASFPEVPEEVELRRRGRTTLTAEEEAQLFLRYNYARCRLSRLAEAQQRRFSKARAEQMVFWYRRAQKTRTDLVKANMALVLAMAKRTRITNVEFSELVSEGNMALLRSVEKFDVARGFKFSTYACRSILKGFNRLATKTGRYRQHFPTEFDPEMERSDYDQKKHEMQHEDTIETLRDILANNRANLTTVEKKVVTERFALSSGGKKRTLAEVGKMVGLTNERVRQIQNAALRKIRVALDDEFLAA